MRSFGNIVYNIILYYMKFPRCNFYGLGHYKTVNPRIAVTSHMSYIVYIYIVYIYSGVRAGHYWHWTSNRNVGLRFDKISVCRCCCAIAQLYNAICGNKECHPLPPLPGTYCRMIKLIFLIRRVRVNWFRGYFGWLSPEHRLDWTGLDWWGPRDWFNDETYVYTHKICKHLQFSQWSATTEQKNSMQMRPTDVRYCI